MKVLIALLALLLLTSVTLAGTIANGDFEAGLNGWQPVAQGNAHATASGDRPAAGRGCLQLTCTGTDQAWALGPALPGAVGDLVQISFSARRGQGKAVVLMSLVADAAGIANVPLWEGVLPADLDWHKISLLLRTPPLPGGGVPRLAFGIVGPAGTWSLDEIDAQPGKPLELPAIKPTGELAQTELLPEGWQPEGNLDARTKEIAGKTELLVDVNGIELGVEPDFTCRRGVRESMVMYGVNRGDKAKELRLKVTAPLGVEAPEWTVPIREKGTTRFRMVLQSLRAGEYWVKLTAKSKDDEKSLPIKVTCQPQYPAMGLMWRDVVDAEALKLARQAYLDLHVLSAAPDTAAFQPMLAAVQNRGQCLIAPLLQSLSPLQYLPAVTRLHGELQAALWVDAPDDVEGATFSVLPRMITDLRTAQPLSCYISPPLTLARDWQKNQLLPTRPALVAAEKMAGVVSATVQPSLLPSPCVLQQITDGKADGVNGALAALGNQTDLSGLRRLLTERNVRVPMLVGELRALPGSDERLAAIHLARAMTTAVSEGATGMLLAPIAGVNNGWGLMPPKALSAVEGQPQQGETPVQQVVRLLTCELAGATPLVALADTPGIATTPDATVCYKPFLRGGEGVVVLWNNTGVPKDVTIEFRFEPVVTHRLSFSYQGEFATRRWDPIMQFSEEAFKRGRPAVYVRLDPLQVQVHSFRLLTPNEAWLRKVEFTAPFKPVEETVIPGREERSWWRDMLRKRGGGI